MNKTIFKIISKELLYTIIISVTLLTFPISNCVADDNVKIAIINNGCHTDCPELEGSIFKVWNFLGSKDGSFNMTSAGTEEYREFKRLYPKYKNITPETANAKLKKKAELQEYAYFEYMKKRAGIGSYIKYADIMIVKNNALHTMDSLVRKSLPKKKSKAKKEYANLTLKQILSMNFDDSKWEKCGQIAFSELYKASKDESWMDFLNKQDQKINLIKNRINGIENEPDKRLLCGDDMKNPNDRDYGNEIVNVEGCESGTFTTGLLHTLCPNADLMVIRAIPVKGDAYDKDLSSAILMAIEEKVDIICLTSGKYTSPNPHMLAKALSLAGKNGTLIIQAAGDKKRDLDKTPYFPAVGDEFGDNIFIRCGSLDNNGNISSNSNFGQKMIDIYAPGEGISSYYAPGEYVTASGSDLAAIKTAACAAKIKRLFPQLKGKDIKEIILKSADTVAIKKEEGQQTLAYFRSLNQEKALEEAILKERKREKKQGNNIDNVAPWNLAEKYSYDNLTNILDKQYVLPNWLDDSEYFQYYTTKNGITENYLVNARTGKKRPLVKDHASFAKQYEELTGSKLEPKDLNIYSFDINPKNLGIGYFKKNNRRFCIDFNKNILSEKDLEEQKNTVDKKNSVKVKSNAPTRFFSCKNHSEDSLYTMLGCGYDLYLRDNNTGNISRISFDGAENASYTRKHSRDTVGKNCRGNWFGHSYICTIRDDRGIENMTLLNSKGENRPKVKNFKMPMPGDKHIREYKMFWYNADTKKGGVLPIDKYKDQEVKTLFKHSKDRFYFTRMSRPADKIDFCYIDMETGDIIELISEECHPHINVNLFNCTVTEDGKYIIWWSERSGKGNYYLYDSNGKYLNRITQGENLVCGRIQNINCEKKEIIFKGYGAEGGNPYYCYYYKVGFDGKKQILLTPGNGNHKANFSKNNDFLVDECSRMDMAPVYSVVNTNKFHKNTSKKEGAKYIAESKKFDIVDLSKIEKIGWRPPKVISVKAADEKTDLYGVMYVPSYLDTNDVNKKYPIISNVYPGPQDDQVPRSFSLDDNGNQSLAELGFIVINIAPRGSSPLRGKDFYNFGYGNLRDYPIADDKHSIETLAEKYHFIDTSRVGIYGHSGGGFEAATAIMTYPKFYKAAVAASGNYNNNIYIRWWGETYHGIHEKKNDKTGKIEFKINIPTTCDLAENLEGDLLLITGESDKNVPPTCTYQLADALMKAGKPFDMLVMAGKDHGVNCPYYDNKIKYFFVEHLLNPKKRHMNIIEHR